jgi:crotonobetainyl-CoA:carnitine CoA-transferase CaiB-like acyl-CoA transferase
MLAYYYRGVTGEGQHVDVSLMESCTWTATIGTLPHWDAAKKIVKRAGNAYILSERNLLNIWECKDGHVMFLLLGGLMGARTNKALTEWMDSEGMAPSFMKERDWSNWDLVKTSDADLAALNEAIGSFFKTHTGEDLENGTIKRGIMLYKASDPKDTVDSPQLKERDFWINIKHDELGDTIKYPGAFAKLSLTPIKILRRAPLIGEHNEQIYKKELGLSNQEFAALKSSGTI